MCIRKKFFLLVFFLVLISVLEPGQCQAQSSRNIRSSFVSAERFFSKGNLSAAKKKYREFLVNYPTKSLIDNALYRLGEIALSQKDFPIAIGYFNIILQQFKYSELTDIVSIKKAFCKYGMREYISAIKLVNKVLEETNDPILKYEAYIIRGNCWKSSGELVKAVHDYMSAFSSVPDNEKKVTNFILDAIEKEENPKKLFNLSKSGSSTFPNGHALYKLLSLYYEKRNFDKFSEYALLFLRNFPGHQKYNIVAEMLTGLKANPERHKAKIGVILPLTGGAALQGEMILKGIQLAHSLSQTAEEIDLVVKDSAGDPQVAVKAAEELAEDPSVIAILGPALGKVAEEVASISENARMPTLSSTSISISALSRNSFFFRNSITDELQGRALAEFAMNELNLKRFAVIYPEDDYGKGLGDSFKENVTAMGGELMVVEKYFERDVDFSELIRKIGGMNDAELKEEAIFLAEETEGRELPDCDLDRFSVPVLEGGLWNTYDEDQYRPFLKLCYEAVFIPGFYEKIGLIIPQLEFFNIVDVKLLGSNGWNSSDLIGLAKGHPEDFYFVDGFFSESTSKIVKDFVGEFSSFFGESPNILAAQAYDAARIIFEAYQSGKKNRESLREGISETKGFRGVSGTTTILPFGDLDKKLFVLTVWKNRIVEAKTATP